MIPRLAPNWGFFVIKAYDPHDAQQVASACNWRAASPQNHKPRLAKFTTRIGAGIQFLTEMKILSVRRDPFCARCFCSAPNLQSGFQQEAKTCVRCMMRKYGELLNDVAVRMRSASTTEQLQKILMDVAAALRFNYIWCGAHTLAARASFDCVAVHNFPDSWIGIAHAGLIPVQIYAELVPSGFFWDDANFQRWLTSRQKVCLHEAQRHGLTNGYTFPISCQAGAGASCSVVPLDDAIDPKTLDLAYILIPAIYARLVLLRLDRRGTSDSGTLSRRERECLSLKAHGAADKEIAAELALSICTVVRHLNRARFRLKAHTREHAVAIALKSGQIT